LDEIQLLTGALDGTARVIEGIGEDQWGLSTPCPDHDVSSLVDHMLGWVQVFAATAEGGAYEDDPDSHRRGADPVTEFRTAAARMVAGWTEHGLDRPVRIRGGELPGPMAFNMTVMEYMAHGWDLATATGQSFPWTDAQAVDALARARVTLPPHYRGEGMAFGLEVDVPDTAAPIDRLAGFLGRTPS
jgi:uncharacterized protein (TIGR03086 family)